MTSEPETVEIEIGEQEAGGRIDRFLGHRFYPAFSRSFLTGLISSGQILVNGRTVRPAYRLGPGDRIVARLEPQTESTPEAEAIDLNVVYEDDFLLAVDKPAGMVVHPGTRVTGGTLVNALLHRNPEIAKVGVVFRPGIVHRLDAHTSGVMIVAKSNHARMNLVEQFKAKKVKKEYRAVVVGEMPFDSDYIDMPLGPQAKHKDRQCVDVEQGKPSSTFYRVLERFPGAAAATYVAAHPFTGRTHQIRVHLAHIGFPIVADPLYGREAQQRYQAERTRRKEQGLTYPTIKRHALHAHRLQLEHPVTGAAMEFTSPLPADMEALIGYYRQIAKEEG